MNRENPFREVVMIAAAVFMAAAFSACGGGGTGNVKAEEPAPAAEKPVPLDHRYSKIVFQGMTADPQVLADYPTALSECESSAMATVISRNIFNAVEKEKAGAKYDDALLVKGSVVSMRIVSGAARFWAGAMAGQSDMVVQLKLTNSATGAVVREKTLSTANNPYGAAWTFGSSDRTLPADMGTIIGEYLASIIPAK